MTSPIPGPAPEGTPQPGPIPAAPPNGYAPQGARTRRPMRAWLSRTCRSMFPATSSSVRGASLH